MEQPQTGGFGALASVLSRDLAEIEDLPSYVAPPPGVWKLQIKDVEQKEIKNKTTITVSYNVLACVALGDPTAEDHLARVAAIKDGDIMSEAFYFDKPDKIETTLSVMKDKFGGLSTVCGTTNLMGILEKMKELKPIVQCQITNRVDDSDKTRFYASTKNMVPAV
jgi:hypothetical protein